MVSLNSQGLQKVVADLLPLAEHRNCARHIYANWKKKGYSSQILRNLFWRAVKCTTDEEFKYAMVDMTAVNSQAAEDFQAVGVYKFCRAYISEWPKCEVVDNNMCECFNSFILNARQKPIIRQGGAPECI